MEYTVTTVGELQTTNITEITSTSLDRFLFLSAMLEFRVNDNVWYWDLDWNSEDRFKQTIRIKVDVITVIWDKVVRVTLLKTLTATSAWL